MRLHFRFPVVDGQGQVRSLKQTMLGPEATRAWIHLAYEGEWRGHVSGEFQFTREVFEHMARNFTRYANPAPLTYEHPDYLGDGKPVPAAGWIHELEVRDGANGAELWAEVEFTTRAASMVRDGEYRFCSVVVDFDAIDRRSGESVGPELWEVGLTNQPFIDGQQPIRFSRRVAATGSPFMNDPKKLERALEAAGLRLSVVALADKTLKQIMQEAFRELGSDDPPMEKLVEYLRAKEALESLKSGKSEDEPAEDPPADKAAASDAPEGDGVVAASDMPEEMSDEAVAPEAMAPDAAAIGARVMELLGIEDPAEALAQVEAMLMAVPEEGEMPMSAEVSEMAKALTHERKLHAETRSRLSRLEDERTRERVQSAITDRVLPVDTDVDVYVRLSRKAPDEFEVLMAGARAQGPKPPTRQLGKAPPRAAEAEDSALEKSMEFQKALGAYGYEKDQDARRQKALKLTRQMIAGGK